MILLEIKEYINLLIMRDKKFNMPNGRYIINILNKKFEVICKMGMIADLKESM